MGTIGVKIDAAEPWADGFRRAIRFWNTVLIADFHEETDLKACSVRVIHGGAAILSSSNVAARSQFTDRPKFRGKIAVSPTVAREMSSAEVYAAAVHELGHILGLKHNASSRSVMYFLDLDGTEVLDDEDILELGRRHQLRVEIAGKHFLAIDQRSVEICLQYSLM